MGVRQRSAALRAERRHRRDSYSLPAPRSARPGDPPHVRARATPLSHSRETTAKFLLRHDENSPTRMPILTVSISSVNCTPLA